MTWNYRVVRRACQTQRGPEYYYGIHSVYYTKLVPTSVTMEPSVPYGDTLEELREELEKMQKAFAKPVIDYDTLEEVKP